MHHRVEETGQDVVRWGTFQDAEHDIHARLDGIPGVPLLPWQVHLGEAVAEGKQLYLRELVPFVRDEQYIVHCELLGRGGSLAFALAIPDARILLLIL